jgi:integrase
MPTKRTLTDQAAQRLKPRAGDIQTDYFDSSYPGLALRVSERRKVWTYGYRIHGKQRRITFDLFPAMGVAAAHDAWRHARDEVRAGRDPAHKDEKSSTLFGDVLAEWLKRDQADNKSYTRVERLVRHGIPPAWHQRQIHDISRRDLLDVIDATVDRGAPVAARRLYARLHRLFVWAVGRGILETNPMQNLPKPGEETSRDRVLSDDELIKVWRAAETLGYPYGPAFQLLILTGARREEIGALRWSEIVDGAVHLEGSRTKNGEPHIIPLSSPARAILGAFHRTAGDGFVFTTTGHALKAWSNAKGKVDEVSGIAPWRTHDLRRTAATGLQRLGVALAVTESVLGHTAGSRGGIIKVYQRHSYAAEKASALEAWGAHVTALIEGQASGKVLPFSAQPLTA